MDLELRKKMLQIRIWQLKAEVIPQAEREAAAAEGQLALIDDLQKLEPHESKGENVDEPT